MLQMFCLNKIFACVCNIHMKIMVFFGCEIHCVLSAFLFVISLNFSFRFTH